MEGEAGDARPARRRLRPALSVLVAVVEPRQAYGRTSEEGQSIEDWHSSSPRRHDLYSASPIAATLIRVSARSFAVSEPEPLGVSPSVHEEATAPPDDQVTVELGSSARAPHDTPASVRVRYFGDYEIESELARGGMGVVFRARQVTLNRLVALKMILAGQLADETDVKRFYTEAEAAANLDHPGIVPIFEVGQHEGQHYFSMGYVEGQSLAQRLAAGPLLPRQAAALLVKVAEAIEYAHSPRRDPPRPQAGAISCSIDGQPARDRLRPGQEAACRQRADRLGSDHGHAQLHAARAGRGGRGASARRPMSMRLGATLYALVTGRPPFQAATAMDTLLQVIGDEPVPPRRLNPALDAISRRSA